MMSVIFLEPVGQYFIIEEYSYLDNWLGVEGSYESTEFSDYEIACEVEDYIERIDYSKHSMLIMGDEPTSMFFYEFNKEHYFIRWLYAPEKFDINEHIVHISKNINMKELQESLDIKFNSLDLVIHNASYLGKDDDNIFQFKAFSNHIKVNTKSYQPDEDTYMICHQFQYL